MDTQRGYYFLSFYQNSLGLAEPEYGSSHCSVLFVATENNCMLARGLTKGPNKGPGCQQLIDE